MCFNPGPQPYDYRPGRVQIGFFDQTLLSSSHKIMGQLEEAAIEIGFSKNQMFFEQIFSEKENRKRDPFKNEVVNPDTQVRDKKEPEDLPGQIKCPLFLIGGLRLETTSLLVGIGYSILANHPNQKITFRSSEQFKNDLITAASGNLTGKFRNRYQNTDILIIDEIQNLLGKDRKMEVFFQMVRALRTEVHRW